VTTAYDILRHRGIPIGKRDFLGPVNWLRYRTEGLGHGVPWIIEASGFGNRSPRAPK
jgi:uncharacterized protein DUF1993